MRQVLARRQPDLHVVVDNIHDPHNAAAILRTCDGFGAATVNLLYGAQEPPELTAGVSVKAHKWLELRWFVDPRECLQALHDDGIRLLATHIDDSAVDFREIDWTLPTAVAFGNEHRGCTDELLKLADGTIQIPMVGMAQSFNVSVSAAIVLAEAARQRAAAGMYEPRWAEWHERQLRKWIEREESEPDQ
jgi:tRNA (guanosine-2'-O-)-methyltransferase